MFASLYGALTVALTASVLAQTKPSPAPAGQAKPAPTAGTTPAAAPAPAPAPDRKPADAAAPGTAGEGAAAANRPQVATITTGWSVACASGAEPGKLRCEVTNAVVLTPVNQRFVSLAVRRDLSTSAEVMVATLPHGVLYTSGILAKVDGADAGKFEPLTSDQQGAYAKLPLTAELIASLEKGKELTVVFDGTNGQKFTVGIPLAGFAAAHDKMKAEN